MDKTRLLKLAEVLETESRGHVLTIPGNGKVEFDMSLVVDNYTSIPSCGTSACAMGYAGLHPWFRKRGLKANVTGGNISFGDSENSFQAAARFFAISKDQAGELFAGQFGGETPKQVAKRIRAFVRRED